MAAPDGLATAYLDAVQNADLDGVVALFTEGGEVVSPLYGTVPARQFYEGLFADTRESRLTLLGRTSGTSVEGRDILTIWFHFDWVLRDGTPAPFDVVDVLELEGSLISRLHILYDTHPLRADFERSRQG
jgi:hypothetical protein